MLVDDGSAAVSLPELPLLAVLPGTGGLTRVSDKRKVRRDHADYFCTTEEGVKGKRAVEWRLVDEVVPGSKFDDSGRRARKEFAAKSRRNGAGKGIALTPLTRSFTRRRRRIRLVSVEFDRARAHRTITLRGPDCAAARVGRRHGRARRGVLAAQARARTRRRHPAYPAQRARRRAIVFKSSAIPPQVLAYENSSTPTRITGWRAKSGYCGSACSSASISPRARW
jgi:enoyl-CoA hydratase/carnithine racemase